MTFNNNEIRVITQMIKDDESRRALEARMGMSIYDDIENLNKMMSEGDTVKMAGMEFTIINVDFRINAHAEYKYVATSLYTCSDETWAYVRNKLMEMYVEDFTTFKNDNKRLVIGY